MHQSTHSHSSTRSRQPSSATVRSVTTRQDLFGEVPVVELPAADSLEEEEIEWAQRTELAAINAPILVDIDDTDFAKSLDEDEEEEEELNEDELLDVSLHNTLSLSQKHIVAAVPATPATVKAFHERHHFEFTVIVVGATALSFNSGFVNGCTYLIGNLPVSHVTGTATKAGMFLADENYEEFAMAICLVACYIFGAAITGTMMPQNSFQLGREYGPLFLIGSFLFLLASFATYYAPDTHLFFYFAAMACGLQNGLTTKYSGNIIRTTHMTGAATDIGLVFGRMMVTDMKERWKLYVLCPMFIAFILGGCASVYIVNRLGKLSLIINVVVFSLIGVAYSVVVGRQLHIPFWRALFGSYVIVEKKIIEQQDKAKKVIKEQQVKATKVIKEQQVKAKRAMKKVADTVKNPLQQMNGEKTPKKHSSYV